MLCSLLDFQNNFLKYKISALFSLMSELNRVPPDLTYSLQ